MGRRTDASFVPPDTVSSVGASWRWDRNAKWASVSLLIVGNLLTTGGFLARDPRVSFLVLRPPTGTAGGARMTGSGTLRLPRQGTIWSIVVRRVTLRIQEIYFVVNINTVDFIVKHDRIRSLTWTCPTILNVEIRKRFQDLVERLLLILVCLSESQKLVTGEFANSVPLEDVVLTDSVYLTDGVVTNSVDLQKIEKVFSILYR